MTSPHPSLPQERAVAPRPQKSEGACTPSIKPRSSLPKRVSYRLLEDISTLLTHRVREGRMPPWQELEGGIQQMVSRFYQDPDHPHPSK